MAAQSRFGLAGLAVVASSCGDGDSGNWASRREIVEAAARCGVPDFQPTEAGAHYAAYVPRNLSNAAQKEDCIYQDLRGRGRLVTR